MPSDSTLAGLPFGAAVGGPDLFYSVQGGLDVKQTAAALSTFFGSGGGGSTNVGGPINVNTLTTVPLVGDGLTDNYDAWRQIMSNLYKLGVQAAPISVTLSAGPNGECVVTWPIAHGLKPNQAFYFLPVGTLPGSVAANTPYFVTFANLTATTFTFSTFNNWEFVIDQPEGAPVAHGAGSSSNVTVILTGIEWIDLYIPPGTYAVHLPFGTAVDRRPIVLPIGISSIRWYGYGVVFDDLCWLVPISTFGAVPWAGPNPSNPQQQGWQLGLYDYINTVTLAQNSVHGPFTVTLQTPANTNRYYVGQWCNICALDLQNGYLHLDSGPQNNHYSEFNKIKSIDKANGTITFENTFKFGYLDTLPNMYNQPNPGEGAGGSTPGGGPAMIVPMGSGFDVEVEVLGITWAGNKDCFGRRYIYIDCEFSYYVAPGYSKEAIFKDCEFPPFSRIILTNQGTALVEVDKLLEYLEFDSCKGDITFASTSCTVCKIINHDGSIVNTPRNIVIEDSANLQQVILGAQYYGTTDSIQVKNSRSMVFDWFARDDGQQHLTTNFGNNIVANWTFTAASGKFSRNLAALPLGARTQQNWCIPGAKYFFNDAAGYYDNMGLPFEILNCWLDSTGVFNFTTTLKALPTRQTSSTVTITIAPPGVVSWASHGLANGTPVLFIYGTDVLPTGLVQNTIYFVVSAALNTFELALTVGGPAINTSGSQSGTHTAVANPLMFNVHPCPKFTCYGNGGSQTITDMEGAVSEPIFSRWRRTYAGFLSSDSIAYQQPFGRLWGTLVSMTVMVKQAAGAADSLTITCPGFTQPNMTLSTFTQVINLATAGTRVVTPAGTTGGVAGDTLTAYGDWLSAGNIGNQNFFGSQLSILPSGATSNQAVVEIEFITDQGITRYSTVHGFDSQSTITGTYVDSSIRAFYPVAPANPAGPNCVMLLHCAQGFVDSSLSQHVVIGHNGADSIFGFYYGTPYKFMLSAVSLGATGWLSGDGGADFAFGSGDFTIDLWVYFNALSGTQAIFSTGVSSANQVNIYAFGGAFHAVFGAHSLTGGVPAATTWTHVALVRSSGTTNLYIDGVSVGSSADATVYVTDPAAPAIGALDPANGGNTLNGYVGEVRVLKGRAAWTADFSPPTSAYYT